MSILNNPAIMRQIIMDHYENPRNKRNIDDPSYKKVRMNSTSCIDDITIFIKDNNQVIEDIAFDGIGCTLAIASTSILTEMIKGRSVKEADYIIEQYFLMHQQKEYDQEILDEALVFVNTYKQASRIKCATIGSEGIKLILKKIERN